jgi:hypothetical protein
MLCASDELQQSCVKASVLAQPTAVLRRSAIAAARSCISLHLRAGLTSIDCTLAKERVRAVVFLSSCCVETLEICRKVCKS